MSSTNKRLIALAGNPNTGKSTLFNALTGQHQHTGNWPGKTVARAEGDFTYQGQEYHLVDLPGTYSLLSTSEDEEIARDFLLFGKPDVTLIIADATRLERNLNLVLQILEITDHAVLVVNLLDEAERNKITLDLKALEELLQIPVVGASVRSGKGIDDVLAAVTAVAEQGHTASLPYRVPNILSSHSDEVEQLTELVQKTLPSLPNARWIALRLLDGDTAITKAIRSESLAPASGDVEALLAHAEEVRWQISKELHDQVSESLYGAAKRIAERVVTFARPERNMLLDRKIDALLTGRYTAFPLMLLLLMAVLWLTIVGSNYPSQWLSHLLVGTLHPIFKGWALSLLPSTLALFLIDGIYLTTAWVVSVMLPPMAIFFPLFTLLEDFGYLPRVAFNLDELFRRSGAHGKQALTMTMGFGCNAAGVVSTRIIDSPRERLIAIITNNFSLCNGRWPTQIMLATIFVAALVPPALASVVSIGAVFMVAILGIGVMFASSALLSKTMLKGEVSTFNLELPPYRPPKLAPLLYTSLVDRTLVVLWRAIVFAAPAGAVIWLLGNISIADSTIAEHLIWWLDDFGWFLGLNGVILLAYLIAIPANEIVIPTILMLTLLTAPHLAGEGGSSATLIDADNIGLVETILRGGGWTTLTAINVMLFSLLHNPCSTTIFTIYKETKSWKWTAVATLLPLFIGLCTTALVAALWRLIA